MDVQWPAGWQQEAREALEPYFGQPTRVDIWLGNDDLKFSARISGNVYLDEGVPTIIHDYSGKWDIYPWRILTGPVLRLYELQPRRRALILFSDERWTRPDGKKGART